MKETLELILKDDVQKILDTFFSAFGIRIGFFSIDCRELKIGLNKPISEFCSLIQTKLYNAGKCRGLDRTMQAQAAASKKLLCYTCHAGLHDVVMPIFVGKQLMGFGMIGQFRTSKSLLPLLAKEWKSRGLSMRRLEAAFARLPYFEPERVPHILNLFSLLVDYIVSKEMVGLRGNVVTNQVVAYVRDNISKQVTLADAARHAGRSASTVYHSFKTVLGKSFKQACIELKLEAADGYFAREPGLAVALVAARLGYDDPFYFSRIYKKYRGVSPSKGREK